MAVRWTPGGRSRARRPAAAPRHDELHRPWRQRLPLLPALVFTVLLTQIPFLMNIWYSLTDWTIVPPRRGSSSGSTTTATSPATSSSATRPG